MAHQKVRQQFVNTEIGPLLRPGTPAARDLLARPRRFERPNFALGAFTHTPASNIQQYQGRCRWRAFGLLRPIGARSSAG
jgi:hypothetical protein